MAGEYLEIYPGVDMIRKEVFAQMVGLHIQSVTWELMSLPVNVFPGLARYQGHVAQVNRLIPGPNANQAPMQ